MNKNRIEFVYCCHAGQYEMKIAGPMWPFRRNTRRNKEKKHQQKQQKAGIIMILRSYVSVSNSCVKKSNVLPSTALRHGGMRSSSRSHTRGTVMIPNAEATQAELEDSNPCPLSLSGPLTSA